MLRIGICGAHGTGKTTLGIDLSKQLKLNLLTNTMRSMWQEMGVFNFETLPPDVRSVFQKHAILKQIHRENLEGKEGFITDRTVLDNLGYAKLSSNLVGVDLEIYECLVKERLKYYTHFIYLPIRFEATEEPLRANLATRADFAQIVESYLDPSAFGSKLLVVTSLDHEQRVAEVVNFVTKNRG